MQSGKTALDKARDNNHKDVAHLLARAPQDSSSLEEDSPSSEQTESRTALRGGSCQQQKLQKYYNKTFAPTSSPPSQRKRRGKEQGWVEGLGEVFSIPLFVHGPKYILKKRETLVLIHFLFANAKLAIWKSRKNQLAGVGWMDAVLCLRGLVAARLRVEHAYYTLINHLQGFWMCGLLGRVCAHWGRRTLILKF
ncbi:hypothetical protein F7725_007553 [Dissostichus mawsoni]|uniref:Uncharacterized protein n=1 Tax=Dissostichus mawsoni TaxID=36200 RepID=A0A7J5Y4T5_DISMA|nr:hypothetical protein F7725_007553 [Dissostichus mawsoni]